MSRVLAAVLAGCALLVVAGAGAVGVLHGRAEAEAISWCDRAATAHAHRLAAVTGAGSDVVVIGDSWSAGWKLADPVGSWPVQLPGRVHVDGFPGSGFSESASPCGAVSFADRAPAALAGRVPTSVVVQGGLNDVDQSYESVRDGFARLMTELAPYRVVVVGPAPAPSRAEGARRVDGWLASLCEEYGVDYVSSLGQRLPYLADRLHLTRAGHADYGRFVAKAVGGAH